VPAVPKPRKRLIDKPFLQWQTTKPCLYCCEPAQEPHHVRWGQGDGKGSAARRPDDYRAIRTDHLCHRALEGADPKRLKWMNEKIGREDVYKHMIHNLIAWADVQGWDKSDIYETIVDAIIGWIVRYRAEGGK